MRLTVEEHAVAIKRYAHLKPVRGWRARACYAGLEGTGRTCTRESGHRGPHVAHGRFAKILAVWDSGPGSAPSTARRRVEQSRARSDSRGSHRQVERRPVGLKDRESHSPVERAFRGLLQFLKAPDEVAFVFLFVLFVYWGVQWILMIMS